MIVGIFIGKNGSMGFKTGQTYRLTTSIIPAGPKTAIVVKDIEDANRWCPYESVETFLENWHVVTTRR